MKIQKPRDKTKVRKFYSQIIVVMMDSSVSCLQLAQEYSECPSGKKGGDLGWFPRGKMAGPFQEVAFNTPVGATSAAFKSTYGFFFPAFNLQIC